MCSHSSCIISFNSLKYLYRWGVGLDHWRNWPKVTGQLEGGGVVGSRIFGSIMSLYKHVSVPHPLFYTSILFLSQMYILKAFISEADWRDLGTHNFKRQGGKQKERERENIRERKKTFCNKPRNIFIFNKRYHWGFHVIIEWSIFF